MAAAGGQPAAADGSAYRAAGLEQERRRFWRNAPGDGGDGA